MLRMPAVAGQFYPDNAKELKAFLGKSINKDCDRISAIGCVLPHAGYVYSGSVVAETVSCLRIPNTCIIVGPNHTGVGADFSIMSEGTWTTPLGDVKINSELASAIMKRCQLLEEDTTAQTREHSLEVELPFLQYINPKVRIVPIVVSVGGIEDYRNIGTSIGKAVKDLKLSGDVLFVASSDMTHYEEDKIARQKDNLAIEAIVVLDENKLLDVVAENDVSMCGVVPVSILITYAKTLGAKSAKLVKYQTSGDTTKDYSSVVGYAGLILN